MCGAPNIVHLDAEFSRGWPDLKVRCCNTVHQTFDPAVPFHSPTLRAKIQNPVAPGFHTRSLSAGAREFCAMYYSWRRQL